jgi:hypothetical protein
MKYITLSKETEINGRLCLAGEIVPVEDGFNTNVAKVVASTEEMNSRIKEDKDKLKYGKTK